MRPKVNYGSYITEDRVKEYCKECGGITKISKPPKYSWRTTFWIVIATIVTTSISLKLIDKI